jgi:hypothetical protein
MKAHRELPVKGWSTGLLSVQCSPPRGHGERAKTLPTKKDKTKTAPSIHFQSVQNNPHHAYKRTATRQENYKGEIRKQKTEK